MNNHDDRTVQPLDNDAQGQAAEERAQNGNLCGEDALRQSAKVAAAQMMDALKQVEALSSALEEAEQKANRYHEQLLRLGAEFDNYRKRTANELVCAGEEGAMKTLRMLLPTIDNLERALDAAREGGSPAIVQGIEMVITNLMDTFAKKGLRVINPECEPFDPRLHEAVMQQPCEREDQKETVAQVLQKGYLYNDQVLRYATVKVFV